MAKGVGPPMLSKRCIGKCHEVLVTLARAGRGCRVALVGRKESEVAAFPVLGRASAEPQVWRLVTELVCAQPQAAKTSTPFETMADLDHIGTC